MRNYSICSKHTSESPLGEMALACIWNRRVYYLCVYFMTGACHKFNILSGGVYLEPEGLLFVCVFYDGSMSQV